jgi:hypothetical protein
VRALVAIVAVTACGRVGFDSHDGATTSSCIPIGHDEDHDGIDDACDGCPHIPDPAQIDTDGDGVDDVCDPNPTSPREHIALFDPFVDARPDWILSGGLAVTYAGDSLLVDTRPGFFTIALGTPISTDEYEFGGSIGRQVGTDIKVAVYGYANGPGYYYCELFDSGLANVFFDLAYTFDRVTYMTGPQSLLTAPLQNGNFTLAMRLAPPNVTCRTGWSPRASMDQGIPGGLVAQTFTLTANALDLKLDYFIEIHTE